MNKHDHGRKYFVRTDYIIHYLTWHPAVTMTIFHRSDGETCKEKELGYCHAVFYGMITTVKNMVHKRFAFISVQTRMQFLKTITHTYKIGFKQCGCDLNLPAGLR